DRLGPNRVGPYGLLQPIVDGVKFVLKEDIIPRHVDRLFYLLAPCIAISTAYLAFAVVAFGPTTAPPKLPHPSPTASHVDREQYEQGRSAFEVQYRNSPVAAGFALFPKRELSLPPTPTGADKKTTDLYATFGQYFRELSDYEATPQFVIAPRLDIGI